VDGKEREFVYYPGSFEPLAIIDDTKAVNLVHTDSVGLSHEITGVDGDLVWSASYDAHGCIEVIGNEALQNPLRFQGQYYDPEIDLSYNRHRYYDHHTGSFISQDPFGLAAGSNVYAYAANVWGWVDPLGLCEDKNPDKIQGIKIFRKDIDILGKNGDDKYGHWWIEINGKESYGWWPKMPVGFLGTIFGVEGELNGQSYFGGSKIRDPHHGDRGAGVVSFDVYGTQSKEETVQSIRNYSNSYNGNWSWPLGQNCHSFQKKMLNDLCLIIK
jgi:RHS repeat-associated protein